MQPKNQRGLPEGSYLETCIGCSLTPPPDGTATPAGGGGEPACTEQPRLLKCTHCPDSQGLTKESSLDPASCDLEAETIANVDGLLGCGPKPAADADDADPSTA